MYKINGISLSLIMGCLFISISVNAQNQNMTDEQIIRQARKRSNEAIAKKDSNALAEIWTDDYYLLTSRNLELSGKENSRHLFAEDFASANSKLFVRSASHIDIYSEWNMAGESGTWTGKWKETDGEVNVRGTYYAKWHKIDGRWKIRAEIFIPLSCTGSKYCQTKPF
jgi:ketosteroid isomerase-like protein